MYDCCRSLDASQGGCCSRSVDEEVLARVQCLRQQDSFTELYRRHGGMVGAFFRKHLYSGARDHDIEELTQEVFTRAWQSRERFRGEASPASFLVAIAKNVLLEHLAQARRRRRPIPTPPSGASGIEGVEVRDLCDRLLEKSESLSDRQREALRLVAMEGLTLTEAAASTRTTYQIIKRRLSAAKFRLREASMGCTQCDGGRTTTYHRCPAETGQVECLRYAALLP